MVCSFVFAPDLFRDKFMVKLSQPDYFIFFPLWEKKFAIVIVKYTSLKIFFYLVSESFSPENIFCFLLGYFFKDDY